MDIVSEMIDFFRLANNFFVTFFAFLRDCLLESPLLSFFGVWLLLIVVILGFRALFDRFL